ncbi:hypothetical protein, partial [Burkholderia cepacia]|uniref:hypothetical protein n=1 Tax=Burkholderia cepacia TaxID=292 RepID=UPI00198186FA
MTGGLPVCRFAGLPVCRFADFAGFAGPPRARQDSRRSGMIGSLDRPPARLRTRCVRRAPRRP